MLDSKGPDLVSLIMSDSRRFCIVLSIQSLVRWSRGWCKWVVLRNKRMPFFHLLKIRPKGKTELRSRTDDTGFGNDSARSAVRACCRIFEAFLLKACIRGFDDGV